MAFVFKKYSPGGGGGGIIDVTEFPTGYKDVDVYIRLDASTYLTFLQLFQEEGITPDLTYYVVDTLPTEGKASDFTMFSEIHCYIANNVPHLYGDLGSGNTWVTVSAMLARKVGLSLSDKGFTSDITAETDAGVYVTYKEGEKPVEGVVYRLTTETELGLWLIVEGQKMNYGEMMAAHGATLVYHIVEALPDAMEPVNLESMTLHLYVLNSTGIGYVSEDGTSALTFGQLILGQEGLDRGWATDVDSIDATLGENMGVYIVPAETFITYGTYSDGVWTDYIDGESMRGKIEGLNGEIETLENQKVTLTTENESLTSANATLTTENESLTSANATLTTEKTELEAEVAEKTASANFTDYTVLAGSANGIAIKEVTNTNIKSIAIPDYVTSIYNNAFQGCQSLTSITIPSSVTSIGSSAFDICSAFTSITIPSSVTSIGRWAFRYCSGLTSITVADGNANYHSAGNCLIETASKTLLTGCRNSVIPTDGSVTIIGDDAFFGCYALTSIAIPECVTSIESGAFGRCSGLTSITVADGNANYHSAGNCLIETASKTLLTGCRNSVIPTDGSVTIIGSSAFSRSPLTSIAIPSSVTSIESEAFGWCQSLTSIIYNGTKAQWKAIPKGYGWDDNIPNYIITCTDGTIAKDGTET